MYKQPMFYALAHFSKFIPPGSMRIQSNLYGNSNPDILALAFKRPDKKITIVVHNNATNPINLAVKHDSLGPINIELKPMSINTIVYDIGI